jgi:hypothetical protein
MCFWFFFFFVFFLAFIFHASLCLVRSTIGHLYKSCCCSFEGQFLDRHCDYVVLIDDDRPCSLTMTTL